MSHTRKSKIHMDAKGVYQDLKLFRASLLTLMNPQLLRERYPKLRESGERTTQTTDDSRISNSVPGQAIPRRTTGSNSRFEEVEPPTPPSLGRACRSTRSLHGD